MNIKPQIRNIFVEIICMLFVLLFVYAATSKLMDFKNFQAQIGQSPLLSVFAEYVSFVVLILEFLIALMLAVPRLRIFGLYAAFFLMIIFSMYVYMILNQSSFVPCSCGGILEKMGWREHLLFNLVFAALAAAAILISNPQYEPSK